LPAAGYFVSSRDDGSAIGIKPVGFSAKPRKQRQDGAEERTTGRDASGRRSMKSSKFQTPSSKLQRSTNHLIIKYWQLYVEFEHWKFLGTWNLELGASKT
jgi:hypothetical protein